MGAVKRLDQHTCTCNGPAVSILFNRIGARPRVSMFPVIGPTKRWLMEILYQSFWRPTSARQLYEWNAICFYGVITCLVLSFDISTAHGLSANSTKGISSNEKHARVGDFSSFTLTLRSNAYVMTLPVPATGRFSSGGVVSRYPE